MRNNDQWIACVAWALFSFIAFTSQVFIFWPWLFGVWSDPNTTLDDSAMNSSSSNYFFLLWSNLNVRALLYLVPFNFSLVMLCWNYYLAMTTDPGSPPLDWYPPIDGSSIEYKRTTHTPRFCRTCDAYKPPRTHHCRTCKKCVLKMDHHCPWIRNCVGYFNYGHFVRFILWTTISTSACFALLALRCWEAYENEQLGVNIGNAPSPEQIFLIVANFCLDGSVLVGISVLSIYHLWIIASNTTTIESWEKDRVLTIIRRGKISDVKCPYSQGLFVNYQLVLGKHPLLWLWPQPMLGDGLRFTVKKDKSEPYDNPLNGMDLSTLTSLPTSGHSSGHASGMVPSRFNPDITPWERSFEPPQYPSNQQEDKKLHAGYSSGQEVLELV